LNLKKSWHPNLLENQKRVWEEERKALLERKRIEELKKEVKEERALEELRKAGAGLNSQQAKVDWLYASSASDSYASDSAKHLLGKRRGESKREDLCVVGIPQHKPRHSAGDFIREDPLSIMKLQEIAQRRRSQSTKQNKVTKSHSQGRRKRQRS
jgi:hypothetical protein